MKKNLKPLLAILIFTSLFLLSCNSNSVVGKKLYLLSLSIKDIPMIKELECNFVSADKMEVRLTLFAYAGTFKTVKSDSTMYNNETRVLTYTLKDGYLEIPELNLTTKFDNDGKGNYGTNTKETFYKESIVDILNTDEAKERIKRGSPMANITSMYLEMLQAPINSQPAVTVKDGKLYLNNSSGSIANTIKPGEVLHLNKDDLIPAEDSFRDYAGSISTGIVQKVDIGEDGIPRSFTVNVSDKDGNRDFDVLLDGGPQFGPKMNEEKLRALKQLLLSGKKVKFETIWKGTSAGYESCLSLDILP